MAEEPDCSVLRIAGVLLDQKMNREKNQDMRRYNPLPMGNGVIVTEQG